LSEVSVNEIILIIIKARKIPFLIFGWKNMKEVFAYVLTLTFLQILSGIS